MEKNKWINKFNTRTLINTFNNIQYKYQIKFIKHIFKIKKKILHTKKKN